MTREELAFGRAMAKLAAEEDPPVNKAMLKQLAANVLVGGAGLFAGIMAGGLIGEGIKRFGPKTLSPRAVEALTMGIKGLGAAAGLATAAGLKRSRQYENIAARRQIEAQRGK